MTLTKITVLGDLLALLPALGKLHEELNGKWNPDMTSQEFILHLVKLFGDNQLTVWAKVEEGEIMYFMAVIDEKPTATFWLFYINTKLRNESQNLAEIAIDNLRQMGFSRIQLITTRLTKSYARWMGKLKFKPKQLMYERELNG